MWINLFLRFSSIEWGHRIVLCWVVIGFWFGFPYCYGAIPYTVLAWIMEIIPKWLLCMFGLISKSKIGRSLWGQHSLGYLWINLLRPPWYKRLRNQRPTLVVPPYVSTSVIVIWIGNVLLLETLLVKFLPAPDPFWNKYALGRVWGLYIYLFVGSFDDPERSGELSFRKLNAIESRNLIWAHSRFPAKAFNLLLYFRERFLNS